ncbi:hypothetical protein I315_04645 [Cryptococcus gattii Ru294]|nr:hypothetical protein I315_04645 [Cryptococcus gattii Ru294]
MPPKGSTIHPPKPPADAPPTAASIQMKANSLGIGEYELPKTTLTKLAKGSLRRRTTKRSQGVAEPSQPPTLSRLSPRWISALRMRWFRLWNKNLPVCQFI